VSTTALTAPPPTSHRATTTVQLFGGPVVLVDGTRVVVPEGSKRLLAFVAMRPGPVDRQYAAGTLWPGGDDERAAGNLRSALWRLRVAGIDVIDADRVTLQVRPGTDVDLARLYAWTTRLLDGTAHDHELAVPDWAPGDIQLLPGWYEDWIVFERERVRQRVLHAMEALSHRLVQHGRRAEAVEAALSVVGMDPLRESAQSALIQAHLSEGNVAEARRTFTSYEALLRCELDVAPGPEVTALVGASPSGRGC
jgi:DNA-binding SARP family transcriptional activator